VGSPPTTTGTDAGQGNSPEVEYLETSGVTPPDRSDSDDYVPPTVSGTLDAEAEPDALVEAEDGPLLEAATGPEFAFSEPSGLSLDSPVVFWALWFLVVATVVVLADTTLTILEKRRRTER